ILGLSRSEENAVSSKWNYKLDNYLEEFLRNGEKLRNYVINESETLDVQLNESVRNKLDRKDPVLLNMIKGNAFSPIHICKDSSCHYILEKDEELCPNSLDHAGWEEEGFLKTIIDHLEDYAESIEEAKFLKKLSKKLKNTPKEKLKTNILKYAPFELLTAGWGQEEEKREKKKEKRNYNLVSANNFQDETIYEWKKLDECQNPKEIYYLIYKRKEK
ncbi:MAG: hypothetical protein D6834_03280, partial [Aquificota bacterium]